jgi:predicted DNA-binding transcriptional regulator YafY
VRRSFARIPRRWTVIVEVDLALDDAATRLPPSLAELAATKTGTRLEMQVDSLDWMATVLAGLDCDFRIEQPAELADAVAALAERLAARAAGSRPPVPGRAATRRSGSPSRRGSRA